MKLGLVANYTHSVASFIDTNDVRGTSPNIFGNNTNNNNNMNQFRFTNNNNPPYSDCLCPDFSNNYTNFMTNEYKPYKYPPVQMYPGSVNPLNTPANFNNIDLKPFLNDNSGLAHNQAYNPMAAALYPRFRQNKQNFFPTNQPKQMIDVKLTFANKEFQGKGLTLQLAKHNAADKALEYFTNPEHFLEAKTLSDSAKNESVKAYRPPQFYQQQIGNFFLIIWWNCSHFDCGSKLI